MKTLLVTVALFLSFTAQATNSDYQPVPVEKLIEYKKALRHAMHENRDAYYGCHFDWVNQTFELSTEIFVNTTNEQPLILMNAYQGYDRSVLNRLVFFTTPDLKSLTKVHAEVYHLGEVNTGDLANPVIVQDYIIESRSDCSLQ